MSVEETQPSAEVQQTEIETGPANEEEVSTPLALPSDTEEFVMPDKFQGKSAEEIARAYTELEKFKGNTPTEPGLEGQSPAPEDATEPPSETPGSNKYMEEFNETGELSEASYAELIEAGNTKEQINETLEYEKYKQQKATNEMADVVGGIEQYNAMEQWATEAYPEEQRQEFVNEFQASGKLAREAMLRDLYSSYKGANEGTDVIHTNESQTTPRKGYSSEHEFQEDIADRRYGTDKSYTKAVEEKMARTKGNW